MANPVLDFGAFTPAEQLTLLTAAKAEYTLRMTTGRVQQGSSAAQSYGLNVMSTDDLVRLINGLTDSLGLTAVNPRVSPNFNTNSQPVPCSSTFGALYP